MAGIISAPGRPGDERMVQDDQAAAGGEGFKQFVVASTPRSRLNSSVRFLDFTLGQVTHSQMKQVPLEPERQLLAECDAAVQIGPAAQQIEAAGKFVVIGNGQVNSVEAPIGCRCCLHLINVFGSIGRIESNLRIIQIRNIAEAKRLLQNAAQRAHESQLDNMVQCRQLLHGVARMVVQGNRVAELAVRVGTLAVGIVLNLPG